MRLMYHQDWRGNFGDDLNIPFFEYVFKGNKSIDSFDKNKKLYGIGTLLNDVHGKISDSIIFGSGFGYGNNIDIDFYTTKIYGVRGFYTAEKLGLDPEKYVIGDPAMYVEFIPGLNLNITRRYKTVVALHHKTCELWDYTSQNTDDLFFLDPGITPLDEYIAIIRNAEFVFAESLHGAIIAATFGIPFYPVSLYTCLESVKWNDFFSLFSLNFPEPLSLKTPNIPILRRIFISQKARNFLEINKIGVPVDISEINKIKDVFLGFNGKGILVDNKEVRKYQNKIKDTISKFQDFYCI